MKRALLLALLLAGGCAQQDAAMLVTMSGQFLIPSNGDELVLDVFDAGSQAAQQIKHLRWCAAATASCPALPAQSPLNASVTLVQGGAAHPHLKLSAALYKAGTATGAGTATADFAAGQTVQVKIALTTP